MKKSPTSASNLHRASRRGGRYLSKLIHEATQAPDHDLPILAHIMRSDVFHSTLDWQTREQLVDGAREAHTLLAANRDLYELEQKAAAALCGEFAVTKKRPGILHCCEQQERSGPRTVA